MPGQAGRKALPNYLKILKGTHQPCRDKVDAPEAPKSKPAPPAWLSKRGKQIFHLMVKRQSGLGIESATYTEPLALLAARLEEIELMTKALKDLGSVTYKTTTGLIKARPEVALKNDAMRHAQSLLSECCLTHTASQRVSAPGKKKQSSEWE